VNRTEQVLHEFNMLKLYPPSDLNIPGPTLFIIRRADSSPMYFSLAYVEVSNQSHKIFLFGNTFK